MENNITNIENIENIETIETIENNIQDNNGNNNLIFRFKFNSEFCDELNKFAKIHQYENFKDFKESWNIWVEENNEIINNEILYLNNIGYNGDILDKMYKSARYYYRKKSNSKNQPKKRRNYIKIQDKEFLNLIDNHIKECISNKNFKPSKNFEDFSNIYNEIINRQIINIRLNNNLSNEDILLKIKKTYKNRYFQGYKDL